MKDSAVGRYISDRFDPEWKLLSETEAYLSYTPEFSQYEGLFRAWRRRLAEQKAGKTSLVSIRSEITELRRTLRLKGYDLSLGLKKVILDGFRNDDAVASGFMRAVLCFSGSEVFTKKGSANHIDLLAELEQDLARRQMNAPMECHFVWFRRKSEGLVLSGAASETAEAWKRLCARAEVNPPKFLSSLKGLQ